MQTIAGIAQDLIRFGLDNPGLIIVSAVVSAAVGFIGYRSTRG